MASAAGCLIQSNYSSGENGNLEVVVLEELELIHYWHDSSFPAATWSRSGFIHQAESAACFFQSDYPTGADHGNFELVFRLENTLVHCFRNNSAAGTPWSAPVPITAPGRKTSGPGCLIQGNYGTDDVHGNFELLVPENATMVHYYRDNGRANFPWFPTTAVAQPLFAFRSDFNRNLATLEFYSPFGGSMLMDGALVGPLQDNGIVDGVARADGTPWFELEDGDGIAAFYLSGHSPKIGTSLAAGLTAVHQNNALDSDLKNIQGSKSAHLQLQTLVPDNHGKSGNVMPLLTPKPGVTPVPVPELGLLRDSGPAFLYATVRSPENFPGGFMLAGLAAQGPDLYALLVGQDPATARFVKSLDMHWTFLATLAEVAAVNAMASVDGFTAILELRGPASKFSLGADLNFARLDLVTGNVVKMPVDPSVDGGSASSIAIVSAGEAYAAVSGGGILGTPRILCWTGTQWTARAQPVIDPAEELFISVVVDPTQTPATIFTATSSKVYVSRDSSKSWARASAGLPEAVSCEELHWVRTPRTSNVFLATFGRSIWSISTDQAW